MANCNLLSNRYLQNYHEWVSFSNLAIFSRITNIYCSCTLVKLQKCLVQVQRSIRAVPYIAVCIYITKCVLGLNSCIHYINFKIHIRSYVLFIWEYCIAGRFGQFGELGKCFIFTKLHKTIQTFTPFFKMHILKFIYISCAWDHTWSFCLTISSNTIALKLSNGRNYLTLMVHSGKNIPSWHKSSMKLELLIFFDIMLRLPNLPLKETTIQKLNSFYHSYVKGK